MLDKISEKNLFVGESVDGNGVIEGVIIDLKQKKNWKPRTESIQYPNRVLECIEWLQKLRAQEGLTKRFFTPCFMSASLAVPLWH